MYKKHHALVTRIGGAYGIDPRLLISVWGLESNFGRFAGVRPSPGGPFRGLVVEDTPYGPVLGSVATRAYCRITGHRDLGPLFLVEAAIEKIELHDLDRPLQYFRGRYLGE